MLLKNNTLIKRDEMVTFKITPILECQIQRMKLSQVQLPIFTKHQVVASLL